MQRADEATRVSEFRTDLQHSPQRSAFIDRLRAERKRPALDWRSKLGTRPGGTRIDMRTGQPA